MKEKIVLAFSGGLAQLMGIQKELQLVFLNGCATKGQVEQLFAAGIKAVIAFLEGNIIGCKEKLSEIEDGN